MAHTPNSAEVSGGSAVSVGADSVVLSPIPEMRVSAVWLRGRS